jgi:hypothetical protein
MSASATRSPIPRGLIEALWCRQRPAGLVLPGLVLPGLVLLSLMVVSVRSARPSLKHCSRLVRL